ncbi:MAG TPA: DUF177 domain-containing protein [Blastocatellia bacterium]|nr:DUF177 domain-containing protein [Blastocatellia bacterium]
MKINIAQISEGEGLSVNHVYPEGEPRLEGEESRLVGRPELNVQATRAGLTVRLVGDVAAKVQFDCDRCLAPLTMPVRQSFDLVYVPPLGAGDEKELADDDLSMGFYQGEEIDVDDIVREQIELALPMARLCSENCEGLCSECGANLNEGKCSCMREEIDPRWAALKELKSDS